LHCAADWRMLIVGGIDLGNWMPWTVAVVSHQPDQLIRDAGFEIFSPQVRMTTHVRGRRRVRLRPLFPNYIFVFIGDAWPRLLDIFGVYALLMMDGEPAIVRQEEMDKLRGRCRDDVLLMPSDERFKVGQEVVAEVGVFRGCVGVYDGMVNCRETALLNLFGGPTKVKFKANELVAV